MNRSSFIRSLSRADGPRANLLLRGALGAIFLSEGIQKFLAPAELGVGRFAKIGIPWPEILAPFVGAVEIIGGALLLAGLLTRAVAMPLLVNMLVAITSTKLVILRRDGLWKAMHEARTDLLMIFCLLFLIAAGAGPLSVDRKLHEGAGGPND